MKKWLYYGWIRFKTWILFNYWKRFSNEDTEELFKLYHKKRYEKAAMKKYIKYFDAHSATFTDDRTLDKSLYIGNIHDDWLDRIDAKIKEKEEKERGN